MVHVNKSIMAFIISRYNCILHKRKFYINHMFFLSAGFTIRVGSYMGLNRYMNCYL